MRVVLATTGMEAVASETCGGVVTVVEALGGTGEAEPPFFVYRVRILTIFLVHFVD
jgi:hypothetical protein